MTQAELIARVRSEIVEGMLDEITREATTMRRQIVQGRRDAECRKDGLTREDAMHVFDLVDDFIAHCRRWNPETK